MKGSIERVTAVINGEMQDRAPMFELHNDVPLENFIAMREAVLENPY